MITVCYKEFKDGTLKLSMSGHAGQAEKGRDVVCAAASSLFYTLGVSLIKMRDELEEDPLIEDHDDAEYKVIKCLPTIQMQGRVKLVYHTILNGLEALANAYPQYISMK